MASRAGKVLVGIGIVGLGLGGFILRFTASRSTYEPAELAQSCAVLGGGLLVLAIGIGKLARPLAGLAVFLIGGGLVGYAAHTIQARSGAYQDHLAARAAVAEALWPVCAGTGIPRAAAVAEHARRPTVILQKTTQGDHYEAALEDSWLPASVEEAQLVVCMETGEHGMGGCDYAGKDGATRFVARTQYTERVEIREARTGRVITETMLYGSMPEDCRSAISESVGKPRDDFRGGMPSKDDEVGFIRPFADGAALPPPPVSSDAAAAAGSTGSAGSATAGSAGAAGSSGSAGAAGSAGSAGQPAEAAPPVDASVAAVRRCLPIVAKECGCVYPCSVGLRDGDHWTVTHAFWKDTPLRAVIEPWCVGKTCTDSFAAEIVCSAICAPKPADPTCHFDAAGTCTGAPAP